jgi:hypothetical protein
VCAHQHCSCTWLQPWHTLWRNSQLQQACTVQDH